MEPLTTALISDKFSPILVEPNSQYTIGREKDNYIVFDDFGISRYHSVITIDSNGTIFVEDKGSKNGTLVNGVRIQEKTALKLNDQISIGSFHIYYQEMSETRNMETMAALGQDITLPAGDFEEQQSMVGSISAHMSMRELFASLEHNQKTGVLHIIYEKERGAIYFRKGNVIRCEFKNQVNLDAIFEVLSLKKGVFEFSPKSLANMSSEIPLTTVQILIKHAASGMN